MKLNKIYGLAVAVASGAALAGCNDYLDITPPSQVTPEVYFTQADQLGTYTINYYATNSAQGGRGNNAFPHHGVGGSSYETFLDDDQGTDNESGTNGKFMVLPSYNTVGSTGGSWGFGRINDLNYFIRTAMERYENGEIEGAESVIRHYIGEGYMLRAIEYYGKLRSLGDFPIVTHNLPLDREYLIQASKRKPRNVVARFILADMDTAISMLSNGAATGGRNRITKDVALLFKARVALYEATFEKYFAGTPFVPDRAAGWPGASKDYNADFSYDNASEVAFFLNEALAASKQVADAHPTLTANNKKVLGADYESMPSNLYYDLFSCQDPSSRDEALMYRSYDKDKGIAHCLNQYIQGGRGYTQEFANCFLMTNGLPIYAPNSGYAGDDFVADTKKNRDYRWQLFMKAPNEYVYLGSTMRIGEGKKNKKDKEFKAPALAGGTVDFTTSTGYTKGKGWTTEQTWNRGGQDNTAAIIFRSAEAYLIYMEAAWEKYGDALDSDAWAYWGKLRTRAGLPADAQVTIAATDLDKEEEWSHDFGLYSAGQRITSKVLYNIRRERRCEFIGEGMRWDDLIRWRALDQLKTQRYFKHGCKFFGPMKDWFMTKKISGENAVYLWDQADKTKNTISSPSDIEGSFNGDARYFSLLRTSSASDWYENGYQWKMGHYLSPIAESHFIESSVDGVDASTSPIYQNPYYSTVHSTPAEQ